MRIAKKNNAQVYEHNALTHKTGYSWPRTSTTQRQNNMLKHLPKMLWEVSKNFIYYALHASHYACIMLQYEQY